MRNTKKYKSLPYNPTSKTFLPLPVMLSHLLVAFTIEHDNEWEHRYWVNSNPAPVPTSLVMWANFLRFVDKDGISVRQLSQKAGYPPGKVHSDLAGMLRWRYVDVDSKNRKKPKLNDIVRPTMTGMQAAEVWQPLVAEIENRWQLRFGDNNVNRLKQALIPIIIAFGRPLPHYFPTLNHFDGMRVRIPYQPSCDPPEKIPLPYLLSQAHHLFTLEAEQISEISLAIQSNVLRIVDLHPIAKKDLPQLSGISKEALSMSINYLKKKGLILEAPSTTDRGKVVKLTESGMAQKRQYTPIIDAVMQIWVDKLSAKHIAELNASLIPFIPHDAEQQSPLFQGLTTAKGLWRAKRDKRVVLPYHPMILYRGGWPDGS